MRKFKEIVTDQLTEKDWEFILQLNFKPVHRAYLEAFRRRNNKPTSLREIWGAVRWQPDIQTNVDKKQPMVFFDQVSSALSTRKVPYRLRSVSSKRDHGSEYRVVKIISKS